MLVLMFFGTYVLGIYVLMFFFPKFALGVFFEALPLCIHTQRFLKSHPVSFLALRIV
jgi:hypothetical protein